MIIVNYVTPDATCFTVTSLLSTSLFAEVHVKKKQAK